jgi:hypothetical protein
MKKILIFVVVACMLCVSISNVTTSIEISKKSNKINIESAKSVEPQTSDTKTMEVIKETVNKYMNMDEYVYETSHNTQNQPSSTLPILGDGEIFGLWITIEYKGQQFSKKVEIQPYVLKGKLSDPNYRTPIRFNVDNDPDDDIETGFGFFKYGIDEKTDSGTVNHGAWATAFDFMQIYNGLDDQLGGLEVWQEFHVNLGLIKNVFDKPSSQSQTVSGANQIISSNKLLKSLSAKMSQHVANQMALLGALPIQAPIENDIQTTQQEYSNQQQYTNNPTPTPASEDYIVFRIGFRSREGEKIPMRFQKTFAVAKERIFQPAIFQHEMDPNDIIGTASMDTLFGFQAFKKGMDIPTYDIEFCVNFNPACYIVTQLTPLSGKTFFYYHSASSEPTEITFTSNLLKGGSASEEENATFSLTLSLDSVPNDLVGPGKWMSFDLNLIGPNSPLGGDFVYRASEKFNVGITVGSPWFEEKLALKGIPDYAKFEWGLDAAIDIEQGELLNVQTVGFASLTMSSKLDEIVLYYPKANPTISDVAWFSVKDIPSSRRLEAGASLNIVNSSMLQIDVNGYVQHDMSSSLGDITIYYPKPDPENDPDMVFFQIPSGSFASSGGISAEGRVYVDPNPDNFFINPNNYFYAKAQRSANSDFGEANFYLPNINIPLLKVYDIPGNAMGTGTFWWNQLKGNLHADRSSSGGNVDPIQFNLVFDDLLLSNELRIGNGYIDVGGKIAEDGYFNLDTSNDMLDNTFEISNLATGRSLSIDAGTISATDFQADWALNTSGQQIQVEELAMSGKLNALKNFAIDIDYNGDNVQFDGDWSMGESAAFEIDFYQEEPIYLDFNLDDYVENIDLNGYVILNNDLHFDVSWKWQAGSFTDPAYFKINQNTNEYNLQEINLYFTYNDLWGADVTLYGLGLYICVEWYWQGGQLYIWPVFSITGNLDLDLLLNGVWHYNVEDNWP